MRRLLALLIPLVVVLAGCTGVQGTDGKAYVGGDGGVLEIKPADRKAPVEASGDTVDGGTLDVADYRGKVLVVNVWWSGCGPCIKELPLLVDATTELGPDVGLAGINIRDASAANAASFERGLGVDFPSIYAPGGQVLLAFEPLNPSAIPSTAVLDQQGRLAALITGEISSEQTLKSVVQTILDEQDPADD